MVTAEDLGRSLRAMAGLVNRRAEALAAFDTSQRGFTTSFVAILLTLPAYVVSLALYRRMQGLEVAGPAVFDDAQLSLGVGLAHLASFLALPLAMAWILRGSHLAARYIPFVVATNWIAVFGSLILAFPGALFLMGLETRALATLFMVGFAVILLQAHWFASKVTLGVGGSIAAAVTGLGLLLQFGIAGLVNPLLG